MLSLSRTIVFFPFFILGYYQKKERLAGKQGSLSIRLFQNPLLILLLLLFIEAVLLFIRPDYSLYYCSMAYFLPSDALIRILILLCVFLFSVPFIKNFFRKVF